MDKTSDAARSYIAQRAELLGAIRLLKGAMRGGAGTDVVIDILFLRRRSFSGANCGETWMQVVPADPCAPSADHSRPLSVNEYFVRHLKNVLGKHAGYEPVRPDVRVQRPLWRRAS